MLSLIAYIALVVFGFLSMAIVGLDYMWWAIAGAVAVWFAALTIVGLAGRRVPDEIDERHWALTVVVGLFVGLGVFMAWHGEMAPPSRIIFWCDVAFLPAYLILFYLRWLIKRRISYAALGVIASLGISLWLLA